MRRGGFTGFVPFALRRQTTTDSVLHIKPRHRVGGTEEPGREPRSTSITSTTSPAYWVSLGLPLAPLALNYGVDDLHGTIMEEKIFHMAGATTPTQQTVRRP